ncbi:hypothetical protein PG984_011858 [Apiospora sp. TS-2023a]
MKVLSIALSLLTTPAAAGPVNVRSDPPTNITGRYTTGRYCNSTDLMGGSCQNMTWESTNKYDCEQFEWYLVQPFEIMQIFDGYRCTLYTEDLVGGCNEQSKTYKTGWNMTVGADFVHAAACQCTDVFPPE